MLFWSELSDLAAFCSVASPGDSSVVVGSSVYRDVVSGSGEGDGNDGVES